jgi:hypothetical protein
MSRDSKFVCTYEWATFTVLVCKWTANISSLTFFYWAIKIDHVRAVGDG